MAYHVADFRVIQGDTSARIGDDNIVWEKEFNTSDRADVERAVLMFMVKGLTVTEEDVAVKINNQQVGVIEHYNGADPNHWFTQIIYVGSSALNAGQNEIQIEAVSYPGAAAGDLFDDFRIRDVVLMYKEKVDLTITVV